MIYEYCGYTLVCYQIVNGNYHVSAWLDKSLKFNAESDSLDSAVAQAKQRIDRE